MLSSYLAVFLNEWASHVYNNWIIYTSNYAADPVFYAIVLFTIDSTPQVHWKSCSSASNCQLVNDHVLQMSKVQVSILWLIFVQNLPKSISDKVQLSIKGNGLGKLQGKHLQGVADKDKEIVTNTNKNQNHW